MGCSHSKTHEVIIDPTTAPSSECGKVSMDIVSTDLIVDETNKSISAIEEPKKEVVVVAPVAEEEPTSQEQPVEVVILEPEATTELVVNEAEVIEKLAANEEESTVEHEVEIEEAIELQEQKSLELEKSATSSTSAPVWTFVADNVTFTVGVAFFNISGSNSKGEEVYLTKRYSEFKVLHAEMAKLMTVEELPDMPGTSFLQSRSDKALLQEREVAFIKMLNAIAQHPGGSQSAPFITFLA